MSSKQKTIKLQSADKEEFVVNEAVAAMSTTIKHLMEDVSGESIPLQNVDGKTLAKVVEYCNKHVDAGDADLKDWDSEFIDVDQTTLIHLIMVYISLSFVIFL